VSNDFENIQMIYEGFRGQHASLRSYGPNMKWAPGDAPPNQTLSNIPGHLPLASPGSARYASGAEGLQGITRPIDEEVPEREISNLEVLEKIEELQQEAENEGMEYAILQLSRLREHVISLSH
tara:strand:+ start:2000 stop:2368 length:369 start_codon:yes stop_codon:yes gene_type:complete